ncbi:anthocyanidin-3-O-glucoside rhamnosyltransferase-like [Hordeum vulgare subsp. vulgare]|uniref:Glycosyltransferase n=1 Tax=Hordeum vulgare subsp. vulgare TaxID=112509 RepID=A0A8I7B4S1_HORVV|nr:anthocyanidin-3-O-glucoside rhamnosyltransferase-like [Hordeum vulgare subsp. vulgare]
MAADGMHVVMFPFLAFGHISPFVQLARKLVAGGGVRVTLLSAAANVPRVEAMLGPAAAAVAVAPLRLQRVPGLPEGAESTAEVSADGAELLKVAVDGTRPQVAALLAELRPDALLFDFATPWVTELAAPLGIKALHFSVFSAVSGAYLMVPSRRLSDGDHDLKSAPAGFPPSSSLATVPAYQAANFSYVFTSFHGEPCVYDRVLAGIQASDAIVIKTCFEMEGPYIDYLAAQHGKPVLVTGPVVPEPPQGELEERWAKWLSSFPDKAVVFASFGSETFLPADAATELLLGLEATNRPFLVVLNFPKGTDTTAELAERTPPGFEERTKGRGVVHTGWVQQQHILRHRSVGCFVNHAGLSSVVEGLVAGCRLVLLPMKGDQYLNAALFARDLRVGTEVARRDGDGWFGRRDVSDAVETAMADGWEGQGTNKWRDFLVDDAVQKRLADDFVTDFKKFVRA